MIGVNRGVVVRRFNDVMEEDFNGSVSSITVAGSAREGGRIFTLLNSINGRGTVDGI